MDVYWIVVGLSQLPYPVVSIGCYGNILIPFLLFRKFGDFGGQCVSATFSQRRDVAWEPYCGPCGSSICVVDAHFFFKNLLSFP